MSAAPSSDSLSALPSLSISNDALSVVLSFLDCRSLNSALVVGKSWSAVILSMRSVGFSVGDVSNATPTFLPLLTSPLARRHIGVLTLGLQCLFASHVAMLVEPMSHLRELKFTVSSQDGPEALEWSFPPNLRVLTVEGGPTGPDAPAIRTAIIGAIAKLPLLESLTLGLPSCAAPAYAQAVYDVTPLAVLPRLRSLTLSFMPTALLAAALRKFPALEDLSLLRMVDEEQLATFFNRLTEPPHALQLRRLVCKGGSNRIAAAMTRIPTITDLTGRFESVSNLKFLTAFPRLSSLAIESLDHERITPQMLADGLIALPRLTRLSVYEPTLNCADLSRVLRALPLLTDLEFDSPAQLESLRCFADAAPTLSRSLIRLTLDELENPALTSSEFEHLRGLSSLTYLSVRYAEEGLIDEATTHALTPPSIWLPKLAQFEYGDY